MQNRELTKVFPDRLLVAIKLVNSIYNFPVFINSTLYLPFSYQSFIFYLVVVLGLMIQKTLKS